MRKNLDKFHNLGVQIKVISFAPPEALESHLEQFSYLSSRAERGVSIPSSRAERGISMGFDFFSDSGRQIYKLFGLGRAKPWKIFHPKTVIKFVTLILKGAKIQKSKEDEFQMGGDFLIDASGHLRYIFRSETPDDRPSVEELLTASRSVV